MIKKIFISLAIILIIAFGFFILGNGVTGMVVVNSNLSVEIKMRNFLQIIFGLMILFISTLFYFYIVIVSWYQKNINYFGGFNNGREKRMGERSYWW